MTCTSPYHSSAAPRSALLILVLHTTVALLAAAHPQQHAQQHAHQFPHSRRHPPPLPEWCSTEPFSNNLKPTTMHRGGPAYKIYHNLAFHSMKWYALADPTLNTSNLEEGISVNTGAVKLPVQSVAGLLKNLKVCYVKGVTLTIDFPFPAFPDNLGHFAEVILPSFSILRSSNWRDNVAGGSQFVNRLMTINLKQPLMDWYSEALIVTIASAVEKMSDFPKPIDAAALESYDKQGWILFENVLVAQDRYTHPHLLTGFTSNEHGDWWKGDGCDRFVSAQWKVGFIHPDDAYEFRRKSYLRHRWQQPANWTQGEPPSLPKYITFLQYPDDNPPITNNDELIKMLREVASAVGWKLRVTSLTMEAPYVSHLTTMANTGLLVARHGPLLANAVLLPPGAIVMELLPYKWEWQSISQIYFNMTQSTGSIHHFGWRPESEKWCTYKEPSDHRYHTWTSQECSSRECLVVHARAGLLVDVETVKAKLLDKLPRAIAGESVESLREPWPTAG